LLGCDGKTDDELRRLASGLIGRQFNDVRRIAEGTDVGALAGVGGDFGAALLTLEVLGKRRGSLADASSWCGGRVITGIGSAAGGTELVERLDGSAAGFARRAGGSDDFGVDQLVGERDGGREGQRILVFGF
jgi:hypothetical protein